VEKPNKYLMTFEDVTLKCLPQQMGKVIAELVATV